MRTPDPRVGCWIDGEWKPLVEATVGLEDPALLAGFGLFETLAVHEGRALDVAEHLARLGRGAARLALDAPAPGEIRATLADAARAIGEPRGWLKIVLTGSGRWLVCGGRLDPAPGRAEARAVLLPWRRSLLDPLSGLKTLNYAANVLGLRLARQRGADEGIWLNTRGHVAEGCTSNLFVVHQGCLLTASERDGILPGVVRGLVLECAGRQRIGVRPGKLRLRRLERATEAFLTSSLRGVEPLVGFEGRPVGDGRPGKLTGRIAAEVARRRLAGSGA